MTSSMPTVDSFIKMRKEAGRRSGGGLKFRLRQQVLLIYAVRRSIEQVKRRMLI